MDFRHFFGFSRSLREFFPFTMFPFEFSQISPQFQVMPHDHQHKIAKFYYADHQTVQKAINKAVEVQQKWDKTSIKDRLDVWLKAADLMAGKYRQRLNAATMLGQSKTAIQAEIDSAAELIDFVR